MNKAEASWAQQLELMRRAGDIEWYAYEPVNLRLAPNTYYNPDFLVLCSDGTLEIHEVKGFWQDAARIKVKVAASTFPFRFKIIKALTKKEGGGFSTTEVFGE
jgi:hypothetical protein